MHVNSFTNRAYYKLFGLLPIGVCAGGAPAFSLQTAAPTVTAVYFVFPFTVTALNGDSSVDTGYTGVIHFTGGGANAVLPADYTFTGGDAGVHVFSATLRTVGNPYITATDTVTSALTANFPIPVTDRAIAMGATPTPWGFSTTLSHNDGTFDASSGVGFFTFPAFGRDVCRGDFNGDGIDDIAVANYEGTPAFFPVFISVLLGNGNGTFKVQNTYSIAADKETLGIATADLNGDGKLDLVVASYHFTPNYARISVLLGNGDGTFQAQQTFDPGIGTGWSRMVLADLNNDNKVDLVIGDGTGSPVQTKCVRVMLGNGNGTFQAQHSYAVAKSTEQSTVVHPCVADVNGDGIPDICALDAQYSIAPSVVSVLLGNGNGTFQARQTYAIGKQGYAVAAADFNGDGKMDLAACNEFYSTVSVLLGNGNGTFQTQATYSVLTSGPSTSPTQVIPYDINFDGVLDLVINNTISEGTNVLLGNGDGTFQSVIYSDVNASPPQGNSAIFNVDGVAKFTVNTPVSAINGTAFAFTVTAISVLGGTRTDYVGAVSFTSSDAAATVSALSVVTANSGTNTVSVLLGNSNGTFQAKQDFTVGTAPYYAATADLNGDGIPDLVVANYTDKTISTLLGNGNGTFQAQSVISTGAVTDQVVVSDVSGDGNQDIVYNDYTGHAVGVMLGNGNGTFKVKQTFAALGPCQRIAVGDLNGDGKADIAAAIRGYSFVSVLLGNNNGTFQAAHTFTTTDSPFGVAIGDVNGDGKSDLVVTSYSLSKVSVLLGNGNGTFQAKTDFTTSSALSSVVLGDVNSDGNTDLVIGSYSGVSVHVLLGAGNGTFGADTTFASGGNAFDVALADVSGDGRLDIVATAKNINSVSVLLGNGNGSFRAASSFTSGAAPDSVSLSHLAVSKLPLTYTFTASDAGVHVFTATLATAGSQTITATETTNSSLTGHSASITVGNALDIIVNNLVDVNLGVLLGNGNGTFGAMGTFAQTATFKNFAVADLNGDTHQDIVAFNVGTSHIVSTMLGNGNGTFQAETDFAQNTATFQWLAAAPLHGGTTVDVAYIINGGTCVLLGNGNGTFGAAATYGGTVGSIRIVIADVNADSNPDLVVTGSNVVGILLGNGNGTFQAQTSYAIKTTGQFTAVADVNNDTTVDLVTTSTANVVCVSLGNGNGTFASGAATTYATGNGPRGLVCLDLNGDGVNDLAVCNYTDSTVSVLLGNNNGTFQAQTTFATAGKAYTVAAADINGDGKVDLVVTDQSTNQVSILLGNGNGTFKAKTDLTVGTSPRQIVLAKTTQ